MALPQIGLLEFIDTLKDLVPEDACDMDYTDDGDLVWECAGLVFLWDASNFVVYYCDAPGGYLVVTGIIVSIEHLKTTVKEAMEAYFYAD